MNKQLARFEQIVERLVEGSLARLFAGPLRPQEIVARLARAMEDNAVAKQAPDRYWIYLNPADRDGFLEGEESLEGLLAEQIALLAREAELELPCTPEVELLYRDEIPRQSVQVTAAITRAQEGQTKALDAVRLRRDVSRPDGNTYLIIDGQRHVPLTRAVYTIGRRLDCDVVLSNPTVSRRHAQLRWRFGRYVLYDLGGSVGTEVNGHPVAESVLTPGDVLSLGAVTIIYGRDAEDELRWDGGTTRGWKRPKSPPGLP